jgi:hypothetical protein
VLSVTLASERKSGQRLYAWPRLSLVHRKVPCDQHLGMAHTKFVIYLRVCHLKDDFERPSGGAIWRHLASTC